VNDTTHSGRDDLNGKLLCYLSHAAFTTQTERVYYHSVSALWKKIKIKNVYLSQCFYIKKKKKSLFI